MESEAQRPEPTSDALAISLDVVLEGTDLFKLQHVTRVEEFARAADDVIEVV